MTRAEFLSKAKELICKDRNDQYGEPEDSFEAIADLWSAYMAVEITPKDVAIMMGLMKVARIKTGAYKEDSWIDALGYLACGAEIAWEEEKRNGR